MMHIQKNIKLCSVAVSTNTPFLASCPNLKFCILCSLFWISWVLCCMAKTLSTISHFQMLSASLLPRLESRHI